MAMMNATQPDDMTAASLASVTIVDSDVDAAEALQALVSAYPGVVDVRTVASPAEAVALLHAGTEVTAYAAGAVVPTRRIILIDVRNDDPSAQESLALLRSELPDAAVVLLCLYPEQSRRELICTLADRCVPKDTSPADLRALLDDLLGEPTVFESPNR